MDNSQEAAERKLFESHIRNKFGEEPPLLYRRDAPGAMFYGEYVNEKIQRHWLGWIARAALQPTEQPEAPILARVLELVEQAKALPSALTTVEPIALTPLQIAWIAGKLRKDADALTAEQPEAAQDERERFERRQRRTGLHVERDFDCIGQDYISPLMQRDWMTWQAAKRDAAQVPMEWIDGAPTAHYAEEWFIAKTTYGDRVVLRALPEEYSYDFTTADGTYFKRDLIKKWMQFPDSEFVPAQAPQERAAVTDAEIRMMFIAHGDPEPKQCHVDAARALLSLSAQSSDCRKDRS